MSEIGSFPVSRPTRHGRGKKLNVAVHPTTASQDLADRKHAMDLYTFLLRLIVLVVLVVLVVLLGLTIAAVVDSSLAGTVVALLSVWAALLGALRLVQ